MVNTVVGMGINGRIVVPRDPVNYRHVIFIISLLDFLIGFCMLTIMSFRVFPFPLMDDILVDHLGILAIIYLFLLYSLQVIMAMILCGGTQKISAERSGLKFSRWFKGSIVMCIMLTFSHLLFLLGEGLSLDLLPGYSISVAQVIFRVFSMAFLAVSNRNLMFTPFSVRLHERIMSRNLLGGGDVTGVRGIRNGNIIFPPPPPYDDLPPTYEEATSTIKHSKEVKK